ncbi:TIR domain-containing protein [Rhizobium ruizarguesonis]
MPKVKAPAQIFLSHAAADKQLVEAFETLLGKCLGITSADIFCSSLEGQGVKKGSNFVDAIRQRVTEAKAVVALITPAYLDSAFCMAELGAAWALNTERLPIVVPPNDFKVMEATLLGIVGVKIDDSDALGQAFEELSGAVSVDKPTSGVVSRALRNFQNSWDSLKKEIAPARRVEAAVHSSVKKERDEAIGARNEAEQELVKAEAQIAALRKARSASDVAKIDAEFDESTWEESLDGAIANIKALYDDLGGREIVRLLILEHFGKNSAPDMHQLRDEVSRAIELDVYDPDSNSWNNTPEVQALDKLVDEVVDLFYEHPEAEKALKAQGKRYNPEKITFWEENL